MLAFLLSLAAAVLIAPIIAAFLPLAGFHFPFPRIFDRVVMVSAAVSLVLFAQRLNLVTLVRDSFDAPQRGARWLLIGFALAIVVILILFGIAAALTHRSFPTTLLVLRAARFLFPALLIAVIEETFFRAILLGGLKRSIGPIAALLVSSIIYALAHLVRSPKHYYLVGYHPAAGLENLAASLARVINPDGLLPMLLGLFVLGLLLGEVFLLTGRVYAAIGLHAGFVIGAKCWTVIAAPPAHLPLWLAGRGPVPLIAAPAAWIAALLLMLILSRLPILSNETKSRSGGVLVKLSNKNRCN